MLDQELLGVICATVKYTTESSFICIYKPSVARSFLLYTLSYTNTTNIEGQLVLQIRKTLFLVFYDFKVKGIKHNEEQLK